MFIIDAYMKTLAFFAVMLLCGWAWRQWQRKNDPEGYKKTTARDDMVKGIGKKIVKGYLKKKGW